MLPEAWICALAAAFERKAGSRFPNHFVVSLQKKYNYLNHKRNGRLVK